MNLSFLMGGGDILDEEIEALGVEIVQKDPDGDWALKIPEESLPQYIELIKAKLAPGFWNEIVGEKEILFIFKFKDGSIKEQILSPENEQENDELCAEFNNESPGKTHNVYKYISENKFYHDFMIAHYADLINRP
ncbi:MAG: hypothetical protein Q8P23_04265 [bacterium]|nr:hypothetical protein [bacterium]